MIRMNKIKYKYLARWVQIIDPSSLHFKKCEVVIDEECLYAGVMCCKLIIGSKIVFVESRYLKLIDI